MITIQELFLYKGLTSEDENLLFCRCTVITRHNYWTDREGGKIAAGFYGSPIGKEAILFMSFRSSSRELPGFMLILYAIVDSSLDIILLLVTDDDP